MFVKPHAAVSDQVIELVRGKFDEHGIAVLAEGSLEAQEIDEKLLIDTHYGAIANRAVRQQPNELAVTDQAKAAFEACFGLAWDEALAQGLVLNATGAAERLGVDALGLERAWRVLQRDVDLVKFGGGFYCGKLSDAAGDSFYAINAFYLNMRAVFTTPPAKIHWFSVVWPSAALSWKDFRRAVLGATDPSAAPDGSIRRAILDGWEGLGLSEQPNTGLNGVHGSASPLEGLFERMNWLGADAETDAFGAELVAAGVPKAMLETWSKDPCVDFEGTTQSLFDLFEDLDAPSVLKRAASLAAAAASS